MKARRERAPSRSFQQAQRSGEKAASPGTAGSPARGNLVDTRADALAQEVGQLIDSARHQVAGAANAALTTFYWQIGTRIRQDVLKQRRAEYGAKIAEAVQLEAVRYNAQIGLELHRQILALTPLVNLEWYRVRDTVNPFTQAPVGPAPAVLLSGAWSGDLAFDDAPADA